MDIDVPSFFLAQSWSHCQRLILCLIVQAETYPLFCPGPLYCLDLQCPRATPSSGGSGVPEWSLSPPQFRRTTNSSESLLSRTQDLTSHTRKHLQNLSWMIYKQFLCTPALAPWWKHWIKSFKLLLNKSPLGKKNNAVCSRDFFCAFWCDPTWIAKSYLVQSKAFMLWLCLVLEVIKIWKDFASKFLWNMNCPCTSCKYWFYLGVCRWQGHFAQASIPPRLLMSSGLLQATSGLARGFCFHPVVFLFKAEQMRPIRGTVEQGIYLSPVPGDSNHCICSRTGIWCWCLLSPAFFILMAGSMSRAQHFPR